MQASAVNLPKALRSVNDAMLAIIAVPDRMEQQRVTACPICSDLPKAEEAVLSNHPKLRQLRHQNREPKNVSNPKQIAALEAVVVVVVRDDEQIINEQ